MAKNFFLVILFVLACSQTWVKVQPRTITDCDNGASQLTMNSITWNPPQLMAGEAADVIFQGRNPSNSLTVNISELDLFLIDVNGGTIAQGSAANWNFGPSQNFEINILLTNLPSSGVLSGVYTYEFAGYSAAGVEVGCWEGLVTVIGSASNGLFLGATGLLAVLLLS